MILFKKNNNFKENAKKRVVTKQLHTTLTDNVYASTIIAHNGMKMLKKQDNLLYTFVNYPLHS